MDTLSATLRGRALFVRLAARDRCRVAAIACCFCAVVTNAVPLARLWAGAVDSPCERVACCCGTVDVCRSTCGCADPASGGRPGIDALPIARSADCTSGPEGLPISAFRLVAPACEVSRSDAFTPPATRWSPARYQSRESSYGEPPSKVPIG